MKIHNSIVNGDQTAYHFVTQNGGRFGEGTSFAYEKNSLKSCNYELRFISIEEWQVGDRVFHCSHYSE